MFLAASCCSFCKCWVWIQNIWLTHSLSFYSIFTGKWFQAWKHGLKREKDIHHMLLFMTFHLILDRDFSDRRRFGRRFISRLMFKKGDLTSAFMQNTSFCSKWEKRVNRCQRKQRKREWEQRERTTFSFFPSSLDLCFISFLLRFSLSLFLSFCMSVFFGWKITSDTGSGTREG